MGNALGRVLVTDAISQQALSVVRSLGRRNIKTTLLAQDGLAPWLFSRYRSESVYCPSARENLDGFVATLLRTVKTRKYATVFPLGDDSLLPLSEHRTQLEPYVKLAIPSHESVVKALDKSQTLTVADEAGVPTPKRFCVRNMADVKALSSEIRYPAVIKPRWSYIWRGNGKARYARSFYVNSPLEFVSTYAKVDLDFPAPVIQEYVPGHNISVALLFDHAEPKAACCIRVHRAIPVTGGTGVLRESVPLDPTLMKYASSLLRSLQWHGVAEVEFRVDSRDSTPKLMEVNARFWGSMEVAIASGVDFPYLLYLLSQGEQIKPVFNYNEGVKFRWLNGDFQNLRSTLKNEEHLINKVSPSRLAVLLQFLRFYEANIHYDGFSMSDPLPFFVTGTLQGMIRKVERVLSG